LRAEPVRRDELLIDSISDYPIRTMPLGTWRLIERLDEDGDAVPYAVADPELWQPVLDELAAIATELQRETETLVREHPEFARGGRAHEAPPLPEFCLWWEKTTILEYRCHECEEWTLGDIWLRRVHVCSDRCAESRRRRVYQTWRLDNPRDPQTVNPTRAKRRAEARADRKCEHCGKPIAAERATKRFCSDLCRVRHHREAARSPGMV
jgi:hypothetical protein